MERVHSITDAESKTADPVAFLKNKTKQVRESKAFKPVLVFSALVLGSYLGARQPMRQMAHDVHDVADRSKRIDHNLFTFAKNTMDRGAEHDQLRHSMRDAITEGTVRGEDFRHYPGVGVLYIDDNGKPEQRNYGSGTPVQ